VKRALNKKINQIVGGAPTTAEIWPRATWQKNNFGNMPVYINKKKGVIKPSKMGYGI
jgi:hypothetical protein